MFTDFVETISKWNVIVGLCVAVIALAFLLAAKPIAAKIYKDKTQEEQASIVLIFKVIAGVLALAGCILVMFVQ